MRISMDATRSYPFLLYMADPSDRMELLIRLIFHITSGKGLEVYRHMDLRIFQNMGYDGWIGS